MKVIFSHSTPFFLAHGGMQTLIEALMREVANIGVEVEPERWWDDSQKGDVLHYIVRPPIHNVRLAQQAGFKVVVTDTIGQVASRGPTRLLLQSWMMNMARATLPPAFLVRLSWDVYREADAVVFIVENEWDIAKSLYHAAPERGHVVPHGLEPEDLEHLARPQLEEDYLVSVATIYPVKNSVLLAQAAQRAQTPIVFLGKPYSPTDPYFLEFKKFVDGRIVRYAGFVSRDDKFRWLRGARGFVMLSQFESGCIAVYEAAAAGLPLLLSDLPWANKVYAKARAVKFARLSSPASVAADLRTFYDTAHRQPGTTFPILTWRQVAEKYAEIYRSIAPRA